MSDNFGVQVSIKAGPHLLNVRGNNANELVDNMTELFGSDVSLKVIRWFEPRDEESLAVAYDAIQQVFPSNTIAYAGPKCPKCGGEMWDNRQSKTNPKAADYRCKDKTCLDEKGYQTSVWADSPRRASRREQ